MAYSCWFVHMSMRNSTLTPFAKLWNRTRCFTEEKHICEIWGSHSSVAQDSGVLGCDSASLLWNIKNHIPNSVPFQLATQVPSKYRLVAHLQIIMQINNSIVKLLLGNSQTHNSLADKWWGWSGATGCIKQLSYGWWWQDNWKI
jgi:hypothetical protein